MRERDRTTPALRRVVEGTGMDVHVGSKPSKLGYSPEGGEAGMSPGPGREGGGGNTNATGSRGP